MEVLNHDLAPIKVSGYRKYHSSFEPSKSHWKIEPDLSGGFDMIELITGPMPYIDAKIYMLKVMKILQKIAKTNEKCSIHINISFDKEKTENVLDYLNRIKLILNVDEDLVYRYFPNRENNFYAKSVKKLIPFKDYSYSTSGMRLIEHNLEIPDTKYYGINIKNASKGRLEYRYVGGKDYQFKTSEVLELLAYFVILTYNCINQELNENDKNLLHDYLHENINMFKNFLKLDSFIAEFPTIKLQVDKNDDYMIIKTYYESYYNDLFEIITNTYDLNDAIINYDTTSQKLEIVDAYVDTIFDIRNILIIDSNVNGGSYENVIFNNCDVKNAHFHNCKIIQSDVWNLKIESSNVDASSIVYNCYMYNSLLDEVMDGGVFRSGKLGQNSEIKDNVKVVTDEYNYFNMRSDA